MQIRMIFKRCIAAITAVVLMIPMLSGMPAQAAEVEGGTGVYNEAQSTYTITYNPAGTAQIPMELFEETLRDCPSYHSVETYIPEMGAAFQTKTVSEGRYIEIEFPYDLDVKKGVYDVTVTFKQINSDNPGEWSNTTNVKLEVEEDMQGVHLINTVVRSDGSEDAVFHLQEGTGPNQIEGIAITFVAKSLKETSSGMSSTGGERFDASGIVLSHNYEEGTITVPKEWLNNYRNSYIPYVYYVCLHFTLANGESASTLNPNDLEPTDEKTVEDFVNPGDDAWYFIYTGEYSEQDPNAGQGGYYDEETGTYIITYNPGKTVRISMDLFEETLNGIQSYKPYEAYVPEIDMALETRAVVMDGRIKYIEIEFPNNIIEEGVYNVTFTFKNASSDPYYPSELTNTTAVKLEVGEYMQEMRLINTVVESDGSKDEVFCFENGTGINEIKSIDGIYLWQKNVPGTDHPAIAIYISSKNFTYDLEEGTVTLFKDFISGLKGKNIQPYVCQLQLTYTTVEDKKIYGDSTKIADSVPINEFVNPGDEAWYFLYREPDSDILPGDINQDQEVNSGDLAYMLQVTNKRIDESELSKSQLEVGDVSGADGEPDGVINSGDLAKLLQYINGRIEGL